VHRAGQAAAAAVDRARADVAALIGANPAGVVFTSGATEANHTALRGAVRLHPGRLVLGAIEHPCVQAAAAEIGRSLPVTRLPPGPDGVVHVPALPPDTTVLALMAANHETGVLQPLGEARLPGVWLHVDATQAAGRIPLDLGDADSVALSAHKLGGPSGVGALVLRDGSPFPPLLGGGSQERGRRAGTVNTAGAVGFAAACRLARAELETRRARWEGQSARLRQGLVALGARLVGPPLTRQDLLLPNTTCVVFRGIPGEALVQALDQRGIAVSSGAACASGSLEPSPVLRAMGDPEPSGGLRVSLGPRTTDDDVEALLATLPGVLAVLRAG
jgi:cysteine desulfurase